jgi:DNA-binding CsgD family transcriptional regulator
MGTIVAIMTNPRTHTHGVAGPRIFGRERELGRLHELVDGVEGRGAALIVRGEPGIGKSTLLAAAARRARAAGMQLLQTSGVQSETQLPFAGLHQLVLPVLARADRLPAPQQTALLAAFGMVEATETPDRFLIALGVLELLSDVAEGGPLVVVVDDAQWLDRSSAGVLAFVARRVEHEPIGVVVAIREGEGSYFDVARLPVLQLRGLDDEAAGALLGSHRRRLAPAVRRRLLEQAGGNPLALVELPALLGSDELGGGTPLPALLPLTERLERAFASRAAELPTPTRTLLLLAAADDAGVLSEVLAAAATIDGGEPTVEGLVPAVDARLAEVDGARVVFRHPLVRSAVYQGATMAERRAAHAAWAKVLADQPERRVWHRASALVGPDEQIATELEQAARRARRRGAISVAVGALERAVELTVDRTRRAQRLLDAAEVVSELGRRELALGFVAEAEQLGLGAGDRRRAILVQDAFDTGEDTVNMERVLEVAERTWHRDADLAMNILRRAAGKSWWIGRSEERRELLVAAVERMGIAKDDPHRLAIVAMVGSPGHVTDVLKHLPRSASAADGDPVAARVLGLAGYTSGHCEFAIDALTVAIAGFRAQGRLALLAQAVVLRAASSLQLGRWDLAIPDTEEGCRLSMETAQPLFAAYARAGQAMLAGLRGDEDEAEAVAAETERAMLPLRGKAALWDIQLARAITALGAGRYAEAYDHLIRTFDPNDPAEHYRKKFWAVGDLAEAALHSERRNEARVVIAQAEAEAGPTPSPRVRAALEYARILLAEDEETGALYEAAFDADLTAWPFARARLQLEYGTWLRRQRRVTESRVPLGAAKAAFDALGVPPWSQRARHELRAAGVESRPRERSEAGELTPQELQIARMAASGLSNREIAQQLYLSHRTVGAHLYRAFPKLGIASRGQLSDALDNAAL